MTVKMLVITQNLSVISKRRGVNHKVLYNIVSNLK